MGGSKEKCADFCDVAQVTKYTHTSYLMSIDVN